MTRRYARSSRGARAPGAAPKNWGENVSVIGALALGGLIATMSIVGSVDADAFVAYLRHVLIPKLWRGAVVVMDNLSTHKIKLVRALIEAAGAQLLYLPRYSPDLNPIEPCWSKLKEFLRARAARTLDALDQALTAAVHAVTPQDARGYFTCCGYLA